MNQTSVSRRNFLKGVGTSAGLALMSGYFVEAKANALATTRDFNLRFEHNMQFQTANTIDIWSALAMPHQFQTPYNLNVWGNYDTYTINDYSNTPILHATWNQAEKNKKLQINFNVATYLTKDSINMPSTLSFEDRYIRTDGEIAQIAHSITQTNDTKMQKMHKIFAFVANNISSQEAQSIKGIRSIKQKDGEVIMRGEDISAASVFVAMCRCVGIDAIEAFGLKLDAGRYNKANTQTPQLYTRSAVKIDDKWIPNDVILAIELLERASELLLNDKEIMDISMRQWDNNWVLFNFSRDIQLDNKANGLLSTMQDVYGEIDGTKLSSYDISHFKSEVVA